MKYILLLAIFTASCRSTYICTAQHVDTTGSITRTNMQMVRAPFRDKALYQFLRSEPVLASDSGWQVHVHKVN